MRLIATIARTILLTMTVKRFRSYLIPLTNDQDQRQAVPKAMNGYPQL